MQKTFIFLAMLAMFASSANADIIDTTEPGALGPGGITSFVGFTFGNGVMADINVVNGETGDTQAVNENRAGTGAIGNGNVGGPIVLEMLAPGCQEKVASDSPLKEIDQLLNK